MKSPVEIIRETIVEALENGYTDHFTPEQIASLVCNQLYLAGYYSLWKPKEMENKNVSSQA